MNQNDLPASPARKPSLKRWMVFMLLALLVSVACVCSSVNLPDFITNIIGGGTATSQPEVQPLSGVLLQDDFSDPTSGWETGEFEGGSVGYKDGTYSVISTQQSTAMWGAAGRSFADVVIEVDATPVLTPANDNNDYGVMCRVQSGGDGYSMNISGDGFYSIQRIESDVYTNLVDWSESSAIRTGKATNHLRVVCDGNKLVLFVNDTLLAEVTDATFSEGDIALAVTTYETDLTEVHFDNLVVRKP
jgi:hypothetical protein